MGIKRNRNLALGSQDFIQLQAQQNSFEFLSKNFPYLAQDEIQQILNQPDEENFELLSKLKNQRAVKPFLEEHTQKFRAGFGTKAPVVKDLGSM